MSRPKTISDLSAEERAAVLLTYDRRLSPAEVFRRWEHTRAWEHAEMEGVKDRHEKAQHEREERRSNQPS